MSGPVVDYRSSRLSTAPCGCTLFANKSATYVHVVHLDVFWDLAQSGGYTWGVAALVHMYDQLDEACRTTTRQLAGYLTLLQVNFAFLICYVRL